MAPSRSTSSDRFTHRREAIIWASAVMRELEHDIACAVRSDLNVLITGEDGVGKKAIARRIHRQGRHGRTRFVVAPSLEVEDSAEAFEAELRKTAPEGTILVEAPERMSLAAQERLRRLIDRDRTRGGGPPMRRDFLRFITAAQTDLHRLVQRQQFSESLFYRLNTIHLIIPPLRHRLEDIPVMLHHVFSRYALPPGPRLSPAAWQRLLSYQWPGNVRELGAVAKALASQPLPRMLAPDDLPMVDARLIDGANGMRPEPATPGFTLKDAFRKDVVKLSFPSCAMEAMTNITLDRHHFHELINRLQQALLLVQLARTTCPGGTDDIDAAIGAIGKAIAAVHQLPRNVAPAETGDNSESAPMNRRAVAT